MGDHTAACPEFVREMSGWFAEGRIVVDEPVVDGVENTVDAVHDLLRGADTG